MGGYSPLLPSFFLLVFGVIRSIHALRVFTKSSSIVKKSFICMIVFILLSEPILVLFHPFSTEWSEWTVYIMAICYAGILIRSPYELWED